MPDGFELDHTSVAVADIDAAGRQLRRELGATPIAGEVLEDFRYVLFHVGDASGGGRLELMEPESPGGFLSRFVGAHGESPHHLTFTVPDLREAVSGVRALGLEVVGEDYSHDKWREAFVMPEPVHHVVVQLADSTADFPPPEVLVSTRQRDVETYPGNRGAVDPRWWEFFWDEEPVRTVTLASTTLRSRDLALSRALFGDVLRGAETSEGDALRFTWSRSSVLVVPDVVAGVASVQCRGHLPEHLHVGLLPIEAAS
jgi:catechol 2,3-dioxygenase-like lactoylglutathione lyase family enzyme